MPNSNREFAEGIMRGWLDGACVCHMLGPSRCATHIAVSAITAALDAKDDASKAEREALRLAWDAYEMEADIAATNEKVRPASAAGKRRAAALVTRAALSSETSGEEPTRKRVEFRCPECGGSHFGNHLGRIVCSDEHSRNCQWVGDGTRENVWRYFVLDGAAFTSQVEYERAAGFGQTIGLRPRKVAAPPREPACPPCLGCGGPTSHYGDFVNHEYECASCGEFTLRIKRLRPAASPQEPEASDASG